MRDMSDPQEDYMAEPIDKSPAKKLRKLSMRERKLIKGVVAGMRPSDAMRQAGYTDLTANRKGKMKVESSPVKEKIAELMDKMGLSDERLLSVMREGIEAHRVVTASLEGIITDEKSYVDHPTRHKYMETGLKLRGHLRDKILGDLPDNVSVVINIGNKPEPAED